MALETSLYSLSSSPFKFFKMLYNVTEAYEVYPGQYSQHPVVITQGGMRDTVNTGVGLEPGGSTLSCLIVFWEWFLLVRIV